MSTEIIENIIEIPEDIQFSLDGKKITIIGEKGKLTRDFIHTKIEFNLNENNLILRVINPKRKESALIGTLSAHIKNMFKGVTEGFIYKMKLVYVHFPMSLKIQNENILIENFIGEKKVRIAKICGDTEISVDGDDVIIKGIDINDVSQTAANLRTATKIRKKDLRKFIDGIYLYSKE